MATSEDTLNRINVLAGLAEDGGGKTPVEGGLEDGLDQLESDKQIAQQLMSHIINNNSLTKPGPGVGGGVASKLQTTTLPVNFSSSLDLSKLMNLGSSNIMAISVPPQGSNLLQGLTPKPADEQTSCSGTPPSVKASDVSQPLDIDVSAMVSQGVVASSQSLLNTLPTSDQGAVLLATSSQASVFSSLGQQTPLVLNSQSPLIRTANGQTAILLNHPPTGPGALGMTGNVTGSQGLTQLAALPGSANVITIPFSFGSLGSPLKLQGIPVQSFVQLPKGIKADLLPQVDLKKDGEDPADSQAATKSLMDILQDPEIQPTLPGDPSLPSAVPTMNAVTSFSQATSSLVFTTTTPTPAVLSPVVQQNGNSVKGQKAFAVSRKRPLEVDESIDTDVEEFVKMFKQRRQALGYTQIDVGKQLGEKYSMSLSQTTICRFESIMLSAQNMKKIMTVLKKWMEEATSKYADKEANSGKKSRKRRTTLTPSIKASLEEYFVNQPKPGSQELSNIAEKVGLEYEVVRVWFCNRRQKIRRESSAPVDTFSMKLEKDSGSANDD
jgi:transcriptional regulator with XRE-family HTH domain